MGLSVYLNGKFVDRDKAYVSIFDHGLLYGDGVFEGIRSYSGLVFRLKGHIDRLYRSASAIQLVIPMKKDALMKAVVATLKKNKLKDAYIRLVVTRGPGDLGLDPRKCRHGRVIFIIADKVALYPERYYREGLHIITAKTRRNLPQALNPRIKSLNYLNNILAKLEATKSGVEEALMLTHDGYVAECTGDNIFIVSKKTLITSPTKIGALEGITRDAVISIAKKRKIIFREKKFKLNEVYKADECFLTGSAAEIVPVVRIDKKTIGRGKPGKLTLELRDEFRKLTKIDGIKYKID
ncbi:MAG: branched-chain-amino-acid transaminase [Candidatus Omnitrophica bacterium CG07_land_8_20_14_0_80_42_15]|uniref:Branched-chain-amino-acid aminotransferase n=1 Tax=Candidatus Aquitaenariimonas noxiae TaxID=1974741 RepID=A0A2J0L4B1_9BACT|nr:MAG: branched-chain-amino-acid transaminase [Candidatus Omnitrophica bacterium CG07_land_8_20_14_0_80_42_15]